MDTIEQIAMDLAEAEQGGSAPVIAVEDLHKSFGSQNVLDGISLAVKRGETLAVLGRSGTGKSVLLRLLIGLLLFDRVYEPGFSSGFHPYRHWVARSVTYRNRCRAGFPIRCRWRRHSSRAVRAPIASIPCNVARRSGGYIEPSRPPLPQPHRSWPRP